MRYWMQLSYNLWLDFITCRNNACDVQFGLAHHASTKEMQENLREGWRNNKYDGHLHETMN